MTNELTADQIQELLDGRGKRRGGGRKDITEPRTIDNWWRQEQHFVDTKTVELACGNIKCLDPKPSRIKVLAMIKGRLCCRYCFLDGWLSGKEFD
jgi:hypothetical protein